MTMASSARAILALVTIVLLASVASTVPFDEHEATHNQETTVSPARAPIFREANQEARVVDAKKSGNHGKSDSALSSVQARLMKELREVHKCASHKKGIIQVELKDDNLQEWNVKLFFVEGALHEDLLELAEKGKQDHIMLQVTFGDNYPHEPPFVRVVYPVLVGDQIREGGSLCMDLLMGHGWNSSYSMESVILMTFTWLQEHRISVSFRQSLTDKSIFSDDLARSTFEELKRFHEVQGWKED